MTVLLIIVGWAVVALIVSAFDRGELQQKARRLICRLHGHDPLLHFDDQRMSLTCHCGWESPGVSVGAKKD